MQQKDNWNFSYINKASKRLQLFTELKASTSNTEYLGGFKLKFMEGSITGYMTSSMKTFATYSKNLSENSMKLDFNT
jgi:hypothetical protein